MTPIHINDPDDSNFFEVEIQITIVRGSGDVAKRLRNLPFPRTIASITQAELVSDRIIAHEMPSLPAHQGSNL